MCSSVTKILKLLIEPLFKEKDAVYTPTGSYTLSELFSVIFPVLSKVQVTDS